MKKTIVLGSLILGLGTSLFAADNTALTQATVKLIKNQVTIQEDIKSIKNDLFVKTKINQRQDQDIHNIQNNISKVKGEILNIKDSINQIQLNINNLSKEANKNIKNIKNLVMKNTQSITTVQKKFKILKNQSNINKQMLLDKMNYLMLQIDKINKKLALMTSSGVQKEGIDTKCQKNNISEKIIDNFIKN